jgi:hypothetical protein
MIDASKCPIKDIAVIIEGPEKSSVKFDCKPVENQKGVFKGVYFPEVNFRVTYIILS